MKKVQVCGFICMSLTIFGSDDVAIFMPVPNSCSDLHLDTRSRFFEHLNKFLDWMISYQNLNYEIGALIKAIEAPPECLLNLESMHGFFSDNKPLLGQFTSCKDDIKIVEQFLFEIDKLQIKSEDRLFYIQEVLSKILAYRNLEEGDEIRIPDFIKEGNFSTYRVAQVFNLGGGMPAFGLVSKDEGKPPILIYRGTHLDLKHRAGIASIVADLDLYGPGYTAFFKIEQQLSAFFVQQELAGKKTAVLGFSLGGILAVYTAIFFNKHIDLTLSAAFNPPGVQRKLLNFCKNQNCINDLKIYVNQHDPVSKWGFLLGNVAILQVPERMGPIMSHMMFMGSKRALDFFNCDLNEENIRHRYFFMPE